LPLHHFAARQIFDDTLEFGEGRTGFSVQTAVAVASMGASKSEEDAALCLAVVQKHRPLLATCSYTSGESV
jgi:hypothetical protein